MLSKSLTFGCNHWVCLSGAPLFFFTPTFLPSLTLPPNPPPSHPPSVFLSSCQLHGWVCYSMLTAEGRREGVTERARAEERLGITKPHAHDGTACSVYNANSSIKKKAWSSLLIISDLNKLEYLKRIRVFLVTGELNEAPLSVLWCVQKKAECGDFRAAIRLLWMTVEMTDRTDTTSSRPLCTHLYAEI